MGKRFAYIELLRFFLALSVVVYHYFYLGPSKSLISSAPSTMLTPFLLLGVEVFFIVSGFVIMFSAASRGPIDFTISRFARLGPTLLVCSTITYVVLSIAPLETLPMSWKSWLSSVLVMPLTVHGGVDLSLWSLNHEITFYALILFIIYYGLTVKRLEIFSWALISLNLIFAILFIYEVPIRWWPLAHYGAFFVIGMLFYLRASGAEHSILLWTAAVGMSFVDCWLELQRVEVRILGHQGPNPLECLIAGAIVIGVFASFVGDSKNRYVVQSLRTGGKRELSTLCHSSSAWLSGDYVGR